MQYVTIYNHYLSGYVPWLHMSQRWEVLRAFIWAYLYFDYAEKVD